MARPIFIVARASPMVRMIAFFSASVFWRGDDRGVDDLPAHGEETGLGQRRVKTLEQNLDRMHPV
jgi:hypothetical protein